VGVSCQIRAFHQPATDPRNDVLNCRALPTPDRQESFSSRDGNRYYEGGCRRVPVMRFLAGILALAVTGAACTSGSTVVRSTPTRSTQAALSPPASGPSPAAEAPVPSPTPPQPPYYIESLRARPYPGGNLQLGDVMFRGSGFTKYHMSWPSGGQTMTGTISLIG